MGGAHRKCSKGDGHNTISVIRLHVRYLHYCGSEISPFQRKISEIKSGQWKFDDTDYWDIDRETLNPLKTFIRNAFEK